MKQTSVEWLMSQLEGDDSKIARVIGLKKYNFLIQQAKELDKQQKMDAWNDGNCNTDLKGNPSANYAISAEHYYNQKYGSETYRSGVLTDGSGAVGEKSGAVSKGSDDHVPDVRKMVEDDNYLTPVDWLMDRIKWIHRETYDYLIKELYLMKYQMRR